jgi:cytidine deaminase
MRGSCRLSAGFAARNVDRLVASADDRVMAKVAAKRIRPAADLIECARIAGVSAYARYSGFCVGAAVRCAGGRIYTGCNVENVAYPLGTCAEAAAIAAARLGEGPKMKILEVAVVATQDNVQRPCSPCGGCRQRVAEFGPEIEVVFFGPGLEPIRRPISQLLPYTFSFAPQP